MTEHTHVWEPPEIVAPLVGPGGPFELVEEDVLGVATTVFRHRPPHLRAVLVAAGERHADLDHLVFPDLTLTFRDVVASVARVADLLASHGVGPGDRVGFAAANVAPYPVAWWATVVSGAVVSSLNGWWTPAELAHGIALSGPKVVVADERRLERLHEAGLPDDVTVIAMAELEALLGPPAPDDPALPDVAIDEDDPAVILFTSGTTGRPKGATLSHRNFVHCPMVIALQGAMALVAAPPAPARPGPPTALEPDGLADLPRLRGAARGRRAGHRDEAGLPPARARGTRSPTCASPRSTGSPRGAGCPRSSGGCSSDPRFDEFDTSCVQSLGGGGATFPPELFRLMSRQAAPGTGRLRLRDERDGLDRGPGSAE